MNTKVNKMRYCLKKSAPDLFLVAGVVAIIGGGIYAVKQTPKAIKILETMEEDSNMDKVKVLAPLYIPSVLSTCAGITSIVCSRNMTNSKIAAMTTAYTVSETALKTYKRKVKEIVDEEKYEEIKSEVNKERLKRTPIGDREIYMANKGDVLMFDSSSGRYFKSNIDTIDKIVNLLNKRMMSEMRISLNEFYSEIGLPPIKIGMDIGWDIDRELISVDTGASIAENGEPCIVIDYDCVRI